MNKKQKANGASKFICITLPGILLCANLFVSASLHAQETETVMRITLEEAVELALQNNLSLESSRISVSTRRRAYNLWWNPFIPNVTIAGAYTRQNSKPEGATLDLSMLGFPPITMPGNPQETFSVPIQASLNISFAVFQGIKLLRQNYEGGLISLENAKSQLERDIRKMYHSMLLLQENVALLRGSFENAGRQVQMARANYNAGLAPELTMLQAQVAMENMRPMIDQAENGLKLSMAQFAMLLNMDYDTPFELVPVENAVNIPLDVNELISRAASGKPEVRELIQTIQILETSKKVQIALLTPALSFSWNTTPTFLGDPANRWLSPTQGSFTVSLGLRLHSFIPFSQDFQAIRDIDDQIKIANIGLAQLIKGTEIEIYNIILSLERTHTNMEALAQNVNLAQRSYNLTEQAYRAGLQDYFQVQNAQVSLHQARVQMLEQQFNYLNDLIDLEYAIGVPFGTLSKRSE